MAKVQFRFVCQQCGATTSKWVGKCPSCGTWNSLVEEAVERKQKVVSSGMEHKVMKLADVSGDESERIPGNDMELNRVLGGGLVKGSMVLIGGEPGIGKSTLMLQAALDPSYGLVLYVSGEESETQVKIRANRLGLKEECPCLILTETRVEVLEQIIPTLQPRVVIIDSIQTLYSEQVESAPGSISQIRESAARLLKVAKSSGIPFFLVGHITKDGSIAGPKILEHMVDTVLQFEGDRHHTYRILRTMKNRFGSTSELGIYEMLSHGLRQVPNPSEILVTYRDQPLSGISLAVTVEGNRPLVVETQALVSTAVYGTPQRTANGYDAKRLNMLLAVLEKKCGFRLMSHDVFVNIAGGLRIDDPGIDLAIAAAIMSSYHDIPLSSDACFVGEVGLSGEIRPVQRMDNRVAEAEKLGYQKVYLPIEPGTLVRRKTTAIDPVLVSRLEELLPQLFG